MRVDLDRPGHLCPTGSIHSRLPLSLDRCLPHKPTPAFPVEVSPVNGNGRWCAEAWPTQQESCPWRRRDPCSYRAWLDHTSYGAWLRLLVCLGHQLKLVNDVGNAGDAADGFDERSALRFVSQHTREGYRPVLHRGRKSCLRSTARAHEPLVHRFGKLFV
jgi:hypothetical protein